MAESHSSAVESDIVWPRPQVMKRGRGQLGLERGLRLEATGDADWLTEEAERVADLLNHAAGRRLVRRGGRGPTLTVSPMNALPKGAGLARVNRAEGYVLSVGRNGMWLAGHDAAGLFYGAQTLAHLLRAGEGRSIPALSVHDWPRFGLRGAHLFLPPRKHMAFFLRFLDFMAAYKLSTLSLEVGGGMEDERHPEINRAWKKFCRDALAYDFDKDNLQPSSKRSETHFHPMFPRTGPVALQVSRYYRKDSTHVELAGGAWLTKREVRRILEECARRHIEVIPEVQSLSHSYYLCCAHPEIAEAQDDPWPDTYCPSNPKSYELLFDVMDEVIEVFRPRIMHIGHDEAYTFRFCPKCRKRTGHDILAGDINKIHGFLASRGVRPLMWGDKLMNITMPDGRRLGGVARSEKDPGTGRWWRQPATWKAADRVPKDLLICDWYWGFDPESERNFHRHGFEVVYGNFSPLRFKDWEKRANVPFVLGAEMSSWCEVSPYEFGHNGVFYQFFPGSDMLWRGRQMPRDRVCRLMAPRMTTEVEAMTNQERWLVRGGPGSLRSLDLSSAAPLPESLRGKMRTGPRVTASTGRGTFDLLTDGRGRLDRAVVLDVERPRSAPVPVGRKVRRLIVLHGTTMEGIFRQPTYYSYHRGPAVVLEYQVRYADGKRRRFRAFYSEDIGQVEGVWPTRDAGYCFRAVPVAAGPAHTLFAQEWVNPRPEVPVESLSARIGPDATDRGEVIIAAVGCLV